MEGAFYIPLIFFIFWGSVLGIIWGALTQKVIKKKGYTGNWFWLGFFFGLIAFIIALAKPDANNSYHQGSINDYSNGSGRTSDTDMSGHYGNRLLANAANYQERRISSGNTQKEGFWRCLCKNYNSDNIEICTFCGRKKDGTFPEKNAVANNSTDNIEKIKKYKELLDIGAITEDEYNEKKKALLKQ